jgi:hypothetical protein
LFAEKGIHYAARERIKGTELNRIDMYIVYQQGYQNRAQIMFYT